MNSGLANEGLRFKEEAVITSITKSGFFSEINYGVKIELTVLDVHDKARYVA